MKKILWFLWPILLWVTIAGATEIDPANAKRATYYNQASAQIAKWLLTDGSVVDQIPYAVVASIVDPANTKRATMYKQTDWQVAKWLLPDGSVVDKMPVDSSGGGCDAVGCDFEAADWKTFLGYTYSDVGAAPASGIALSALAAQAAYTILGNNTAGNASPTALSAADIKTLLGLVIGTDVPGISGTPTNEQLVVWELDGTAWKLKAGGAKTTDNSTISHFLYKDADGHIEDANVTGSGTTMVLSISPTITTPAITSLEVLIDCNGNADPYAYCTSANASTLTATHTSRTIINSYGRGEAQTVTLPAAATGMTFIALVATQHNSAWKIQRAGSDTITWSSGGTDTAGKTYFQETNQAVGARVSCVTYKTGASAWSWLCGSITGTWVTD